MVTIKIQSPTQGPLITVRFDDDADVGVPMALLARGVPGGTQWLGDIASGTRLPAILPSTPPPVHSGAGIFATVAPYLIPLLCSGDRSERPVAVAGPVPAPEADSAIAGVPMAETATQAVASEIARLTDDLEKQIASSTVLHSGQKEFLTQILSMVRAGQMGLDRLLENIWKILTDDLLNRAELLGANVRTVVQEDLSYSRIQYDPANAELHNLLTPLLYVLVALQLKVPNQPALVESTKFGATIFLPTWKSMVDLYQSHMGAIVWVARSLSVDESVLLWEAQRSPVRIVMGRLGEWLHDLDAGVHPLIFMTFELYHALSAGRLAPEKEVLLDMMKRLVTVENQYAEDILTRLLPLAVRMSSSMDDPVRVAVLWEVLELDLALRAMKNGATVEVSDDAIKISAGFKNRAVEDLMRDFLNVMEGIRRGGKKVIHVSKARNTWTFELMRWPKLKPTADAAHTIPWDDYVEWMRQDIAPLTSTSPDDVHPLAHAWEMIREAQ